MKYKNKLILAGISYAVILTITIAFFSAATIKQDVQSAKYIFFAFLVTSVGMALYVRKHVD